VLGAVTAAVGGCERLAELEMVRLTLYEEYFRVRSLR
jgi:hypothetical protein